MRKIIFKVSTMLALSGLIALSFVSTSCGDDDDEIVTDTTTHNSGTDTTPTDSTGTVTPGTDSTSTDSTVTGLVPVPKEIKFGEDGTIAVTGTNLSQVTKIQLGDVVLEGDALKVDGDTLTISLGDAELPTGKQTVTVIYKDATGAEHSVPLPVDIPEQAAVVVPSLGGITFNEDGSVTVTGENLSMITKLQIGDVVLEGTDFTAEDNKITLSAANLPSGEQTVTVTYKDAAGEEKTADVTVTIPEVEVPVVDASVLFSGTTDLGQWEGGVVIPADQLSGLTAQTLVSVKGTLESAATVEYRQIQLKSAADNWPALEATMQSAAGSLYPMFSGQFDFTLSEADLESIKENGLVIAGQGITITDVTIIGTKISETLAENVESYKNFITKEALSDIVANAVSGYSKLVFHCALAKDDENTWDYVGQLAGWNSEWENSTDEFGDFTFKLQGKVPTGATGETFDIEFSVDDVLSLANTDIFCVNIWDGKFEISSVEVTYVVK